MLPFTICLNHDRLYDFVVFQVDYNCSFELAEIRMLETVLESSAHACCTNGVSIIKQTEQE